LDVELILLMAEEEFQQVFSASAKENSALKDIGN